MTDAARAFDAWITAEYLRLRERLAAAGALDEDAFHDAYLSVRAALTEEDFAGAFRKAYRKAGGRRAAFRTTDERTLERLAATAPDEEGEERGKAREEFAAAVWREIRLTYPPLRVMIWESRVMRGTPYADLAAAAGISAAAAKRGVERINADMRARYERAG